MPPRPIPSLKILLIWRMVLLAFSDPLFVTSYICSITSVIFFFQTHQQNLNLIQPHFTFFSINPNYLSGYHKKWFEFQESKTKQNPFFCCVYMYWRIEARFSLGILKNKTLWEIFSVLNPKIFCVSIGNLFILVERGKKREKECVCVFVCDWGKINWDKKCKKMHRKRKFKNQSKNVSKKKTVQQKI
jgi:hypothetical protein